MRTTLTIDDDVDVLLRQVCENRQASMKQVINDALRAGLSQLAAPPSPKRSLYRTKPVSLGKPALPELDNIVEVLAISEGEHHL